LKILLLGRNGQLGWELERCLQPIGEVFAFDFPEVNMVDPTSVREAIREHPSDVVINATAYTDVDKAERESELAEAINGNAPGILAEEARRLDALLIHYSTDYVFDGSKGSPYSENDSANPINVYGSSKYHGEQAIQQAGGDTLILRTSWVYASRTVAGIHQPGGFVKKVMEWSRIKETLRVVTDQVGNPTWSRMLAEITCQLLAGGLDELRARGGLYHLAGSGFTNRYDWANAILELDPLKKDQITKELLPALTTDFPTAAPRPLFSALDCSRFTATFGLRLPDWKTALRLALE
jgi:dTDP-4-dehydrorhamnose reductase